MKLKTKKMLSLGVVTLLAGLPFLVGAGGFDQARNIGDAALENTTITTIIFNVMQWLLLIVTFVAIIGFVISGIMYITAGGSDRADDARKWLTYSIIGIVVALVGYIVIRFISDFYAGGLQTA